MDVYIEYVIIDNMVFNSLILYFTLLSVKLKSSRIRLFCASAVGTAVAMLLPLINANQYILLIIKLSLGILMVIIALTKYSFKLIISAFSLFLVYTFAFGGGIIGIFYLLGVPFSAGYTISYINEIPVGIFIGGVALIVYLALRLNKYLQFKRTISGSTINCKLYVGDKAFDTVGFYDSGNNLIDNTNGKKVCFLADKTIKNTIKHLMATKTLSNSSILNTHHLKYATVSGAGKALAVDATIEIDSISHNISLAISQVNSDHYQIILSNLLDIK